LVFNEILHLLKSGFPGGANLLWRALHEIVCVSYFISEHGEGVAKRFLDYEVVEAYFQAQAFLEYKRNVEGVSFSGGDFKVLQKRFNAVERMYGVDFVKRSNFPFGWIPRSVLRTRSFREVERVVGLGVFRPYYDLAGYGVFGGRNLVVFKLGVVKDGDRRVVVPVGPSNYGLADPGRSAAISLGQVTACLLMSGSGVKRLIVVEALRNLVDEICDAFGEVEAEFGKDSGS
jgi:hypothetical protein